jgi:hypothetical protein
MSWIRKQLLSERIHIIRFIPGIMENKKDKIDKFYEELAMNARKGETYILKFWNDPVSYVAIPMIPPGSHSETEEYFRYQVLQPDKDKGMYRASLSEIEVLERM